MHLAAFEFVQRTIQNFGPGAFVIEIGGRDINGSVRWLFGDARYVSIDVAAGPGVDVIADGAAYEPGDAPDRVVCCEVLEHSPQADRILWNALRMLQPGGLMLITAAGPGREPHSASDGGPLQPGEYYQNIDPDQLREWLRVAGACDSDIEINPDTCDVYAVAHKCEFY